MSSLPSRRQGAALHRTSVRSGLAIIAACFLAGFPPASAQRVEPMVFDLEPAGAAASTTLRVSNTRPTPITVEITVQRIAMAEDGTETTTPADADFTIFPAQSIIPANQVQAFRVRYVGAAGLDRSQSYRVSVRQVPVKLQPGESGLIMAVNFHTLANVSPRGVRPDLHVTEMRPGPQPGTLQVALENRGKRYARLTRTNWTFREPGGQERKSIGSTMFSGIKGNLVPPASRRQLTITAPEGATPAATVEIELVEGR